MVNINNLSSGAQSIIKDIAKKDGTNSDFSSLDLARADKSQIEKLVKELKKNGYDANEQDLVWKIYDMTSSNAIDISDGLASMEAIDLEEGSSMSTVFLDIGDVSETDKSSLKEVRKSIVKIDNINENQDTWIDLADNKINESYISADWRIDRAAKAREKMESVYNFKPSNPFDYNELKSFIKSNISQDQLPDFIQTYMRSYYEHPGDNTEWLDFDSTSAAKGIFFGSPPPLEQLPDGRCLIDCQGYAMLGQILFEDFVSSKNTQDNFYMAIEVSGKTTPDSKQKKAGKNGENVGHEVALMKIKDKFYVVDNDNIRPIKLTDKEKEVLNQMMKIKGGWDFDIDDVGVDRDLFPSLYDYFENDNGNWNWQNVKMSWDENDALGNG